MIRVALIPTGRTELKGLGPSLSRLFPSVEFTPIALRPGEPYDGFTTATLPLALRPITTGKLPSLDTPLTPDGQRVVSASADHTIRVLSLSEGVRP